MTSPPEHLNNAMLLQEKSALIYQTSRGPSLREVGAKLLREALHELYPNLHIDPDHTLIVTPHWEPAGESLNSFEPLIETMTTTLLAQSRSAQAANFIEGEHFLTPAPLTEYPVQLAVSIEDIANLLNNYAPLLFIEFQQQQLAYWNAPISGKPRWHELSDTLRKALNLQQIKGWTADDCEVARAVSAYPDKTERATANTAIPGIQACLIDIDYDEPDNVRHVVLSGAIVLKATHNNREILLLHSIEGGYETFASMQALGASLPTRMGMEDTGHTWQWRLFEPDGNVFDYVAWALIAGQMEAISSLQSSADATTLPISPASSGPGNFSAEEKVHFDQLEAAIPAWLANASASDLQAYGHYLSNQGRLRNASGLNDIQLISEYAEQQMRNAIIADRSAHANDAAALPLEDLRIVVVSSLSVGAFTLPNPQETHVETLGQFALQNNTPYKAALKFLNNQACPAWLTVSYLVKIAQQVDVGKNYPALLKAHLIDDDTLAFDQLQRYVNLLPDLLKLKALECKLQKDGGVNATGYRYICELMDRAQGHPPQESQDIVIRPLSFVPRHRLLSTGDTVANMFIIGPRHPHNSPCLLYRPALEQPLLQFASLQNMIYAIHQPGELRDSVLAWLPTPALSFEYSQYVFPVGLPSPWLTMQTGIEMLFNLDLSGPISLGTDEIRENLLPTLFTSNASTLVEQADRQSLSNGERRWELLRDSGWAIFNIASTFLTGPVGTAAWVWQCIGQLQQGLEARERGDSLVQWTSLGDVLMTLGMILIHRASQRRNRVEVERRPGKRRSSLQQKSVPRLLAPATAATTMTFDSHLLTGQLPLEHATTLEETASVPRRAPGPLGIYLDTLKVSAPDLNNADVTILKSAPPHLYQLDDKRYARVGTRWFEVMTNGDEEVEIFNRKSPMRNGPLLIHDLHGNWYVDTRLRLRGGGLKSRLKAIRLQKEQRKDALEEKIQAFKRQETAIKDEVQALQDAMLLAPVDGYEAHAKAYTDRIESVIDNYREALAQLGEWRQLGGTIGYTYDMLRLTTLLEKYLSLWFTVKGSLYSTIIAPMTGEGAINPNVPVGGDLPTIGRATEVSHAIIQRIGWAQEALDGLKVLGRASREASHTIKSLMPRYSQLDYKANLIGMAYEQCVQEQASEMMPLARAAVADIVVDASEASHELNDLLKPAQAPRPAAQRIDVLSQLTDTFADALQRLEDLPEQYPAMTHPEAVARLHDQIKEFQAIAQAQLSALVPEDEWAVEQEETPAVAGPSRLQVKVTKTRPRNSPTDTELPAQTAHFKRLMPKSEQPAKPVRKDIEVIADALGLNLEVESFITRTRKDAERANRIPADMQHLFEQQALKYEDEAAAVDIASANIRSTTGQPPPVSTLSAELRSGAEQLRTAGINVRASMLKKRKPRQEYFQWLHQNTQVTVLRNELGRIRTKNRKDYFQEYRILDTTRSDQPLWVAHFHYEAADSPASQPTAAHLKIADSYLQTLEPELRQQLELIEPMDYVLRRINDPLTRSLFLDLEPIKPAATNS